MTEILIVGAGPTGLTAALELARNGVKTRIIDRDEGPTPLSKAVGISPHSLDLLEASGVIERLLAEGMKIERAHVWSDDKALLDLDLTLLRHRFKFLLSLPQSRTETIMQERLAELGVEVERRTKLVTAANENDSRMTVVTEGDHGGSAEYDFVFGADGAQSVVREEARIPFDGFVHERLWSIADVMLPDWTYDHEAAHVFLQDHGDMIFIISTGKDRYRAVSNTPAALARLPGGNAASAKVLLADTFRLPIKQAQTYQKGGVYLAGDAAHVHSPIGARGMNLGIEDACCFARRMLDGSLAGYTDERHPIGKRWIAFSERALAAVQAEGMVATTLRDMVIRLAGSVPALQRLGIDRVAGLRE